MPNGAVCRERHVLYTHLVGMNSLSRGRLLWRLLRCANKHIRSNRLQVHQSRSGDALFTPLADRRLPYVAKLRNRRGSAKVVNYFAVVHGAYLRGA